MKKNKKRLLSLIITFALLFGSVGVTQAEEGDALPENQTGSVELQEQENEGTQADVKSEEEQEVKKETQAEEKQETSSKKQSAKAVKSVSAEPVTEEKKEADVEEKTGYGMTVTLRVDGYGQSITYPTTVKLPDTYKTLEEYGLTEVTDPGFYTILHVMAQYCVNQGIDPADSEKGIDVSMGGYGAFLNDFLGAKSNVSSTSFMFMVNNAIAKEGDTWYTWDNCPLNNGDSIVIYDYNYNETDSVYAYFTQDILNVHANESFQTQLKALNGYGMSGKTSDAQILVYDMQGNLLTYGDDYYDYGPTDVNGVSRICIMQPGSYILSAERINETSGRHELNRPYMKVIVDEEVSYTDKEAVETAKQSLNLGGVSEVVSDLNLPIYGRFDTDIEWKSSDESLIKTDGTVIRPAGADKTVILTAIIKKNAAQAEREFKVTVKGRPMLESLTTDVGNLAYDDQIQEYTVYVPEEAKKITVKGKIADDASQSIITTYKNDGTVNTEEVNSDTSPEFEVESFLTDADGKDMLPQEITVETTLNGPVTGKITITVKRIVSCVELPSTWPTHYGNSNNNAVVDQYTATENAELAWAVPGESVNEWVKSAGHPIIVNDNLYVARGQKLQIIDRKTGLVKQSVELAQKVGYYSYISYGDGKIFVPLGNGQVQCFNATTLESLFITKVPGEYWQGLSTVYYQNGMIYTGATTGSGSEGSFMAYSTLDTIPEEPLEEVKPVWSVDTGKGYYGSGAVSVNDGKHLAFAGDAGIVTIVDAVTGKERSKLELAGAARSSVVSAEGYLWLTTKSLQYGENSGNWIYKIAVNSEGKAYVMEKTALPDKTTCTPVVADGKILVGGGEGMSGFFQVYDLNLKLLSETTVSGEVKAVTATTAYDDLYAYFVPNNRPGAIHVAKISEDNSITINILHEPDQKNYSLSNVLVAEDGMIYYSNDSGYLFALKPGKTEPVNPAPEPEPTPDPDKDNNNNKETDTEDEDSDDTIKVVKKLTPTKRTINAATKKKKSQSESIADAVESLTAKGETSLTVRNVPDTLESEVFKALKEHPDFRLILDCGTYTISLKGSDITNPEASLNTRLIEVEGTLSEKDAKALGNYQQLALIQEGVFPGKVTVVYKLPEQLTEAKKLYLYAITELTKAQKAALDSGYAMFVLDSPGEYVLADKKAESVEETKAETEESVEELLPEQAQKDSLPTWLLVLMGVAGGLIAGGIIGGVVASKKRKKDDTWER